MSVIFINVGTRKTNFGYSSLSKLERVNAISALIEVSIRRGWDSDLIARGRELMPLVAQESESLTLAGLCRQWLTQYGKSA